MALSLSLYLASQSRRMAALTQKLVAEDHPAANEEMGRASAPRPKGHVLWFHAPNAYKALAVIEIIRALSDDWPEVSYVLTTPRSAKSALSARSLPPRCVHQFAPADVPAFAERFVRHWSPDIIIWTGSALRPALIKSAHDTGVPMIMLDATTGKIGAGLFSSNLAMSRTTQRELMRMFHFVGTSDQTVANDLIKRGLSSNSIKPIGPLDEISTALPHRESDRAELTELLASRPAWLVAHLCAEEETVIFDSFAQALRSAHRLLMILVPDTEDRADEICAALRARGHRVRIRSHGQEPDEDTQVYIADTPDEMGLWYRLAPVTYMGGTLCAGRRGTSPFEAAALGSAIVHGMHMGDHETAYQRLIAGGASRLVQDEKTLTKALRDLMAPDRAAAMAHNAWLVTSAGAEAADYAVRRLNDMIDALGVAA